MTFRVSTSMLNCSRLLAVPALAMAMCLASCTTYTPAGDGISHDAMTYPSTSLNPATLQLKDTRTGEVLWTYEVPPDRELVIRFYPGRNSVNPEMPDEMRWEEWEKDQRHGSLENKMPVPAKEYRRVDVTYRKAEPAPTRSQG